MGGFYVDKYNRHREIHWACRDCIVRPICTEECDKLLLQHWLCEDCTKDIAGECDEPCDKVKRSQMIELFNYYYGDRMRDLMIKHIEQTSIFGLFRKPDKPSNIFPELIK